MRTIESIDNGLKEIAKLELTIQELNKAHGLKLIVLSEHELIDFATKVARNYVNEGEAFKASTKQLDMFLTK